MRTELEHLLQYPVHTAGGIMTTEFVRLEPSMTVVSPGDLILGANEGRNMPTQIGAFIFEAAISRDAARRRLIDDFLAVFGGEPQPIMTHLIESGRLSLDDVQEAEKHLRKLLKDKKEKKP